MDHFALPEDELALARGEHRLHRNFMGYTVKTAPDMVGLGVSSIADVEGAFAQNEKILTFHRQAVEKGLLPVKRGYALDADDLIRRQVISTLMCNFYLDRRKIEETHGIDFATYFAHELEALKEPEAHGFVRVTPQEIEVVGNGCLFIRNICMLFDRYLPEREKAGKPFFSRTV